jgi:hypothetical protein
MSRIAMQATSVAEPVTGVAVAIRVVVRISPVVVTGQASG